MTTVRKQKSGDQLTVGDWLAPDQVTDGAAEVLFAHAYPASADGSRDNDGKHVQLSVREQGKLVPCGTTVAGTTLFDLASDEDLAALRATAERAQKIADIRALADWLEANPDMPMPHGSLYAYVDGTPSSDHGPAGMAKMRRIAEELSAELVVRRQDFTTVARRFGKIEYEVRCFHENGRPAEAKLEAAGHRVVFVRQDGTQVDVTEEPGEDPTGLAYSRDADDPTPVSPARVPLHTGGVVDGGALVDETPAPSLRSRVLQRYHFSLAEPAQRDAVEAARIAALDEDNRRAADDVLAGLHVEEHGRGRVTNPGLARFMAEREDKRRAADTVPVPAEDATPTPPSGYGPLPGGGYGLRDAEGAVVHIRDGQAITQAEHDEAFGGDWNADGDRETPASEAR